MTAYMVAKGTARPSAAQARWVTERERELAKIAVRQHGIVTRKQLLDLGLGSRTIERRVERAQLHRLHRGVFAVADPTPSARGRWLAAVLACGPDAALSHRSAAALWGLVRDRRGPVEVTSAVGRKRPGLIVHECGLHASEREVNGRIPVTSAVRTIFDLAEVVDEDELEQAFEEADRLKLLRLRGLEEVCARAHGRRALQRIRPLIEEARAPIVSRSELEAMVLRLCRRHGLPMPQTNVNVLGHEVDALWPSRKLIVEADGVVFHGHRESFERDRARDAARQVAGYRVIRVTYRRLRREPEVVARELGELLGIVPSNVAGKDRRAGS